MNQISPNIAVLIPCYNEERSIIAVIDEVCAILPNAKIYVFDNNSTDKSADLVRAKITQLESAQSAQIYGGGGIAFLITARQSQSNPKA